MSDIKYKVTFEKRELTPTEREAELDFSRVLQRIAKQILTKELKPDESPHSTILL